MNKLKSTTTTISRLNCLHALYAARSLDKAYSFAQLARPTTLNEAQSTSDYYNHVYQAKSTAYEFMYPIEETMNRSIDEYNHYKTALQDCKFNKKVMESYSNYYANNRRETAMLKCNVDYILKCSDTILHYNMKVITEQEFYEYIGRIAESGDRFFYFDPRLIVKTFLIAVRKFDEIERKIELRKKPK